MGVSNNHFLLPRLDVSQPYHDRSTDSKTPERDPRSPRGSIPESPKKRFGPRGSPTHTSMSCLDLNASNPPPSLPPIPAAQQALQPVPTSSTNTTPVSLPPVKKGSRSGSRRSSIWPPFASTK